MSKKHVFPFRIYYKDTDAGGIIYHVNFLSFAEHGRTEMLRDCGFENSDLMKEHGIAFVVRHADIDYLSPGFLDDALEMHSVITAMKNTSIVFRQTVYRPKDGAILCVMQISLVCVNIEGIKPLRIPQTIRDAFETFQENMQNT